MPLRSPWSDESKTLAEVLTPFLSEFRKDRRFYGFLMPQNALPFRKLFTLLKTAPSLCWRAEFYGKWAASRQPTNEQSARIGERVRP